MRKEQTAAEWAETLFSLYEQKMFAVAYAIVRDEGRAEEAVMDAFERLVKAGERQTGRWADGSGRLAEAAASHNVDFVLSVSADPEELPAFMKQYVI